MFPGPSGGDDFVDGGVLRLPAKRALEFFFAGDQNGWIARPTRRKFARNFVAGDAFGCIEHLEDGKAAAVADVESFAGNFLDGFEGADVRIGNVEHVNVVADASAIGRGVIRAEDFDLRDDADSGVENFRDDVSFNAMRFAALGRGAGGVEITQRSVVESGIGAIVGEDFFEAEFGFAVGIDGILGMVFGDGDDVGLAVGGGGGREDELFHAVASHGIEEIDAAGDVGCVERARFPYGFGDKSFASEVHDGIDFVLGEDFFDLSADAKIDAAENGSWRNGGGVAFLKIVESDDVVAASEEKLRTDATNVACCAGDENVQGSNLTLSGEDELAAGASVVTVQLFKLAG